MRVNIRLYPDYRNTILRLAALDLCFFADKQFLLLLLIDLNNNRKNE